VLRQTAIAVVVGGVLLGVLAVRRHRAD
jgi:hypothetical protein